LLGGGIDSDRTLTKPPPAFPLSDNERSTDQAKEDARYNNNFNKSLKGQGRRQRIPERLLRQRNQLLLRVNLLPSLKRFKNSEAKTHPTISARL